MIGLEDRRGLARDIHTAHQGGVRSRLPVQQLALLRTLQHWKAVTGVIRGDGRPLAVRNTPRHALSESDRILLEDVEREPKEVVVDLGFRGIDRDNPRVEITHRGKYKCCSPDGGVTVHTIR